MADIVNANREKTIKCKNVLKGCTTIKDSLRTYNEDEDGDGDDEEEEIEDLNIGRLNEEARSLLQPCSSGANLQLSLSLKTFEGFSDRFPSGVQNTVSSTMAVLNINSHNSKQCSNGPHKQHVLQDSMVAIELVEDLEDEAECNSSSSPFHSAAEDFGAEHDPTRTRDRAPLLIKGPVKKGGFHHFLSGIRPTKTQHRNNCSSSNNNEESIERQESIQKLGNFKDYPPINHHRPVCSYGIVLAAVSCIFFATSALIVKVSILHPMELLAVRGLIQWILIAPLVISSGNSFFGPQGSRSLLLARAVLGSVALIMSFASIHLIPLADAATVIFTSPVFVSIFACVCLGELCSWFDVAMIILTLLGVLLVSKPSFGFISSGSWVGIAGTSCGLAASMLTALAFIVLRQLKHVHYAVTVLWFSTVLASFGAVLTLALGGFTMPTEWLSIVECGAIGICGFFGQILLTKALQIENAGPVSVARTMDIVLAFFYQITLLHDTPDWYSYLGSLLVVSCVLLTALRRWYLESHETTMTNRNDGKGNEQTIS